MPLYPAPVYRIAGDRGLLLELGDGIDPHVNRAVRKMSLAIEREGIPGILEVIPTYRSILLVYDPMRIRPHEIRRIVSQLDLASSEATLPPPRKVEIPVCYGGEFGPDMEFVASYTGLTVEEVIEIHSAPLYQIYMMGFTPGFPFLGGLPQVLATPRLPTPRVQVPAGSVAIAANQTGIYPIASPGGWRLIGRTPLRLFFPERAEPFLYRPGDFIKFRPITPEEFQEILKRENSSGLP
jgi:KipI family sensor histidine kinase inhibitor